MSNGAQSPAPRRHLAKEGDECDSCRAFWMNRNAAPRRLVSIGKTTDYGIPICICPYCDGTPIIRNNAQDQ